MSGIIRLYPAAWRERYEPEFVELLATRPPGLMDRFDIVRGALDAHLHPQVRRPNEVPPPALAEGSQPRLVRRLGFGAIAGTGLWAVGLIVALLGPVRYDVDGAYRDGAAAFPFLLAAIALFAGGLAGQLVVLPKDARLARFGAGLALPFTLVWGILPWLLWAGALMIGGLTILAVGGYRSRAWPRWSSASVGGACLVAVVLIAYGISTAIDRMAGGVLITAAATAFVPAWLGVGATLIRQPA
jgi:hypothetical protein